MDDLVVFLIKFVKVEHCWATQHTVCHWLKNYEAKIRSRVPSLQLLNKHHRQQKASGSGIHAWEIGFFYVQSDFGLFALFGACNLFPHSHLQTKLRLVQIKGPRTLKSFHLKNDFFFCFCSSWFNMVIFFYLSVMHVGRRSGILILSHFFS